ALASVLPKPTRPVKSVATCPEASRADTVMSSGSPWVMLAGPLMWNWATAARRVRSSSASRRRRTRAPRPFSPRPDGRALERGAFRGALSAIEDLLRGDFKTRCQPRVALGLPQQPEDRVGKDHLAAELRPPLVSGKFFQGRPQQGESPIEILPPLL